MAFRAWIEAWVRLGKVPSSTWETIEFWEKSADLPASVGLPAEDVEPGLLGCRRRSGGHIGHPEGPGEAHDREIAEDQDLPDVDGIGEFPVLHRKRAMQQLAELPITAFREAAIVVAQLRREEIADPILSAGIEIGHPACQGGTNRRLVRRLRPGSRSGEQENGANPYPAAHLRKFS